MDCVILNNAHAPQTGNSNYGKLIMNKSIRNKVVVTSVRPNYIHSTSNDIHTDVARAIYWGGSDKHHEIPLFAESARISASIFPLTFLLLRCWY